MHMLAYIDNSIFTIFSEMEKREGKNVSSACLWIFIRKQQF